MDTVLQHWPAWQPHLSLVTHYGSKEPQESSFLGLVLTGLFTGQVTLSKLLPSSSLSFLLYKTGLV